MIKSIIAIILLIGLAACDSQQGSAVSQQGTADSQTVEKNDKAYALRPTAYTWPSSKADVVVSKDVLAKNYYLIIDGSGSMTEEKCSDGMQKIDVAKTAITQFVNRIPANANIGLLTFDMSGVKQKAPLGINRQQVLQDIAAINAGGGTPLQTSVLYGFQALELQARTQLGYGEYHLVVVTDGEASSGEDPSPAVTQLLAESPVILHTIGFCIGPGHSLNVSGQTDYRAANNPAELQQGLADVLAESNEYTIDKFTGDDKKQ